MFHPIRADSLLVLLLGEKVINFNVEEANIFSSGQREGGRWWVMWMVQWEENTWGRKIQSGGRCISVVIVQQRIAMNE
jgi:hypothetical protein